MPSFRKILIASSKGGVGKSTTAIGLSAAFARGGKNVLLVDLDYASRSLDMLLDAQDLTLKDFGDIVAGDPVKTVSVSPLKELPDLNLIPACNADRLRYLSESGDRTIEETVLAGVETIVQSGEYDILICDTGGGLDCACAVAGQFDIALVTSEQGKTSIRAAEYAAARLESSGAPVRRLVICSFDLKAISRENRAGIIEMIDSSSLPCAGVVPYDPRLQRMQDSGTVPPEKSLTSIAYGNIAKRILGDDVRLFEGINGLFSRRMKAL